jgi:hypothetical protein
MNAIAHTKFNAAKITGPYPLMAVFLGVCEVLLLAWLVRAQDARERSLAGLLIIALLGLSLIVILRIRESDVRQVTAPGIGPIEPAQKGTTLAEIESPPVTRISSPEGSYSIQKPPEDWRLVRMSMREWTMATLGIRAPMQPDGESTSKDEPREILSLQAPHEVAIGPTPGQSTIEGRKLPSALTVLFTPELAIIPFDRLAPPSFTPRTLAQNFLVFAGGVANFPLHTNGITTGRFPISGRPYQSIQLAQNMREVEVDGRLAESMTINILAIGVEGYLRDFVLVMRYSSIGTDIDGAMTAETKVLQDLVNSFEPLQVDNPAERSRLLEEEAGKRYREFWTEHGREAFDTELLVEALRLKSVDLDNGIEMAKVIRDLKRFEIMAKELNLEDKNLGDLWRALHKAEKDGGTSELREKIESLIEYARKGRDEGDGSDAVESDGRSTEVGVNSTEGVGSEGGPKRPRTQRARRSSGEAGR